MCFVESALFRALLTMRPRRPPFSPSNIRVACHDLCSRHSSLATRHFPNSFRMTSFTDAHPLTPLESHRSKKGGGERVRRVPYLGTPHRASEKDANPEGASRPRDLSSRTYTACRPRFNTPRYLSTPHPAQPRAGILSFTSHKSPVTNHQSRHMLPVFNHFRTLFRNGALPNPLSSITCSLFPIQRRGIPSSFRAFNFQLSTVNLLHLLATRLPRASRGHSPLFISIFPCFLTSLLSCSLTSLLRCFPSEIAWVRREGCRRWRRVRGNGSAGARGLSLCGSSGC